MADTITLDRVIGFAVEHGATVRLIGDDQQLAAIGAGGVLRDIARAQGVVRLDEVVRFVEPVEAEASMALREGDRAALGYYLDH
jgi:ATP-dependent exoDNAse (exonuclease V) alpha subunit